MMKKVLYGVALALFAGVSVGSLQSCKDDINDLKSQTKFDLSDLQYKLNLEAKRLQDSINDHTKSINDIRKNYATVQYVREKADSLQRILNNKIDTDIAAAKDELTAAFSHEDSVLAGKIDGALLRLTNLKDSINPILKTYGDSIALLNGYVESQAKSIEAIQTALKNDSIALAKAGATLDSLKSENEEIWKSLYGPGGISEQMSSIFTYAQDVENNLNATIARLDQLVTGILIQGVYSPVFGDFSLPIGVKSNLVFGWYGNNTFEEFKFPNSKSEYSATGDVNATFNYASMDNKGGALVIPEGTYPVLDTLGTVYVTLNPLGHDFNGTPIKIQNSLGKDLPFDVVLKPSEKLLTHGYTRDEISSSLYEGAVVLNTDNAEDIESVEVKIDDKLKSSMKNVLKDPSKQTAAHLLKAVYDQMSGMLPAYALRYGWDVQNSDPEFSPKSYAVLSQFDLAVATAKPLGFKSLDGVGTSKQLPTIGHIENLINKIKDNMSLNFELKPIVLDKINIDLSNIEFTVSTDGVELLIIIPDIAYLTEDAQGNETTAEKTLVISNNIDAIKANPAAKIPNYDPNKTYEYSKLDGLNSLDKAITDGIKSALTSAGTEISSQVEEILSTQINKVVDDLGSQINGQIDEMFDSVFDQFEPYYGKIDKVFDIYNKIAKKVNNFLKDPYAYVQVTALYSINGDYGFVSGKASDPTLFDKKDGNAFSVYLTSYTGELIVPAYKKYVAVTGVKKNGQWLSGADAKYGPYNKGDLNKVLDGNQVRVVVDASNFESGCVYEFTYQAVDYRGATSTKKFYIEVK